MSLNDNDPNILTFANPELDRRIGGLPVPCMMLMEGPNDSGKTLICQQTTYGALKQERGVLFITTEDTTKVFINNMERLNWKVTDDYLNGRLKVTSLNMVDMKWDDEISKYYIVALVNYIKQRSDKHEIIIIDSLTHLITHASPSDVLEFFRNCRLIVDNNRKSFIFTLHPYALPQDLLVRIRSFCDGHIVLEVKNIRDRNALSLTVVKLKGATKTVGSFITFEVSPAYGIKILPYSATKG